MAQIKKRILIDALIIISFSTVYGSVDDRYLTLYK